MGEFEFYLKQGLSHILDLNGYDHILFVVMLCAAYPIQSWKRILILVTAFTIGHSVTLALSVFDVLTINSGLVELMIPITILLTCLHNIFLTKKQKQQGVYKYVTAMFFGLIHGLGFSNYLSAIMMGMGSITLPLFSFNIGLEIGQLCIVALFMILVYISELLGASFKLRKNIISGLGILIVLPMIIERL